MIVTVEVRLLFFLLLITSFSCQKFDDFPTVELADHATLFLAHRGGGSSGHPENSHAAAKAGLAALDGIELDLQLSSDGTIWMAHDADLPDCDVGKYSCFSQHSDQEILDLSACSGQNFSPGRLAKVLKEVKTNFPEAIISLDVKLWSPCSFDDLALPLKMKELAEEINYLISSLKIRNRVFVESEHLPFLIYLKNRNPLIECHLLAFSAIEKAGIDALKNGLDGVSYKFHPDEDIEIESLKSKGLTVQFWTVNTAEALKKALALNPHTIQTDRLDLFELMP